MPLQLAEDRIAGRHLYLGCHGAGGLVLLASPAVARGRSAVVQHHTQQELQLGHITAALVLLLCAAACHGRLIGICANWHLL